MINIVAVTSENIHDADPIALEVTGFAFGDVEPMTEIEYDIQAPDDHVGVPEVGHHGADSNCTPRASSGRGFKLVDPQLVPPTLCPQSFSVDSTSQRLLLEWITPEDDEIDIEIDISALNEHGTVGTRITEQEVNGARLENATIDDSTISMKLIPDSDSPRVTVEFSMEELEITATEPVEGLSYEMTVAGDANETVDTEPFDITEEPEPDDT